MMGIYDRYEHDPAFHTLVDVMYAHIERLKFTPTEIREAAMLAQIKFESRNQRPTSFSIDDVLSRKV